MCVNIQAREPSSPVGPSISRLYVLRPFQSNPRRPSSAIASLWRSTRTGQDDIPVSGSSYSFRRGRTGVGDGGSVGGRTAGVGERSSLLASPPGSAGVLRRRNEETVLYVLLASQTAPIWARERRKGKGEEEGEGKKGKGKV
jgi:hypothetical protein